MTLSPILSKESSLWNFAYYSGCGNLFLLASDPEDIQSHLSSPQIAKLCASLEETVDGMLFLGKGLRMHYYNQDGSRASMCGNGLRCLGHFAHTLGAPDQFSLDTDLGKRAIFIQNNHLVKTDMGEKPSVSHPLADWYFCSTGVPHAVQFTSKVQEGTIEELARPIRYHRVFAPNGTNVCFASIGQNEIFLRTYERGVERETGACGTGACAASVIAAECFRLPFPHTIHFRSGENATVDLHENRLFLTAPCHFLKYHTVQNPLIAPPCTPKAR